MNLNYKKEPFLQAYSYPQIPLFPIYGYDNSEEAEKDFDYMKQLYPRSSIKIQELIEDTCDQLEYEGSIMFDEYPDRLQLALLANKIYNQVVPSALSASSAPGQADSPVSAASETPAASTYSSCLETAMGDNETTELQAEGRPAPPPNRHPGGPFPPGRPVPPPPGPPPGHPTPPPPWRPAPPPNDNQNPNWLRNLIEVMLCNEMCQRRRRYRSRKRWM